MTFTDSEQRFLARQTHGHLATVGPDGIPQVKPVGFTYNPALGTIDIAGMNMARSAKYRNIRANPRVAFVVNEVTAPTVDGALAEQQIAPLIGQTFPRGEAAKAHDAIEARRTVAKTLLLTG